MSTEAPFGGHLPFGNQPAFLVVDAVMAYLTPGEPLYHPRFEVALASLERLVAATRSASLPVVFTGVRYGAGGRDGGLFFRKVPSLKAFLGDLPGGAFPPGLLPRTDELVVMKQYASAFFGTSLATTLHAMGVDTLLIGGFSTSGCVRASALDALQNGFTPYVVSDACGDRDEASHAANLFDLQTKYAEVVNEAQATALIVRA